MSEFGLLMLTGIAGSLLLAAVLLLAVRLRRGLRRQRQALGLQLMAGFRMLLTHIQQHRGLSSGYLNGSTELIAEIEPLQYAVSRNFADLAIIDAGLESNQFWQGITQHWARLAGNYKRLEPDNNLAQHNQLIKNVLLLIDDMARQFELLMLRNENQKPLHLYWRELLSAAEYIGQARAIGTGVAAKCHCDKVARMRLQILCGQIESNTQHLWQEAGAGSSASSDIAQLLQCINEHLLKGTPTISAADYFAVATRAIDNLLNRFDQLLKDQSWR